MLFLLCSVCVCVSSFLSLTCLSLPSDVNYLSSTAPPVAAEWASLLRPLRGREPEGMWNLLSIVREMFKRNDRNSIPLLEIITDECLATEKVRKEGLHWHSPGTHLGIVRCSPGAKCECVCVLESHVDGTV